MSKAGLWFKMLAAGAIMCIGGPALVYYVTPTDEEVFKKYNPELQKRALENREVRQEQFNNFVLQLKEHSRSDKSIWVAAKEYEDKIKAQAAEEQRRQAVQSQERREEIRKQSLGGE